MEEYRIYLFKTVLVTIRILYTDTYIPYDSGIVAYVCRGNEVSIEDRFTLWMDAG